MVCLLCYSNMDSHDHLFFNCHFSNMLWLKVLKKLKLTGKSSNWAEVIERFGEFYNGNSIGSVVRRLCLATCVYMIWQERNNRIFREEEINVDVLVQCICDVIKCRLSSLTVKKTRAIIDVGKEWDVTFKDSTK